MTSEITLLCGICGDGTEDPRLVTECTSCDRTFHLNPYNNKDHRDCGDALVGPAQGVEFWCNVCLEQLNAEINANPMDPRAMLDELAGPAELRALVRPAAQRTEAAPTSAPAAAPSTAPAPSPAPARTPVPARAAGPTTSRPTPPPASSAASTPPPRRDRSQPRKRYRRIDG